MATTTKAAKGRKLATEQNRMIKTVCSWTEMIERKAEFKKLSPVAQFMVQEVITCITDTVTENIKQHWNNLDTTHGWAKAPMCDSNRNGLREAFENFLEDADNGIYTEKTACSVDEYKRKAQERSVQTFGYVLRELSDLGRNDLPWLHFSFNDKTKGYRVQMKSTFDEWKRSQNKQDATVRVKPKKRLDNRKRAQSYGL
tara:strand:- start:723 stop:1319 length:597 start_codon:yes stop_codon:yes gene_type:complete